jgi:hypothetical protein
MVPVPTHATRRAWLAASLSIVARRTGLVLLAKSSRPNSDRFACGRRIGPETDRGGAKGHGQGDGGSVNAFGGVNERLDDVFKMLVEAARLEARAVHMASGG